jgi:hypothetical protein
MAMTMDLQGPHHLVVLSTKLKMQSVAEQAMTLLMS